MLEGTQTALKVYHYIVNQLDFNLPCIQLIYKSMLKKKRLFPFFQIRFFL